MCILVTSVVLTIVLIWFVDSSYKKSQPCGSCNNDSHHSSVCKNCKYYERSSRKWYVDHGPRSYFESIGDDNAK